MLVITTAFTGYPAGRKRVFVVGESPTDLDPDYEALLVAKGLAKRVEPEAQIDNRGGRRKAERPGTAEAE